MTAVVTLSSSSSAVPKENSFGIHKLGDDLINKIAAGEVVERPASVVKELVENSIDAGSTRIEVTLKEGGKKLIQITDNGAGIPPQELRLAMARHATSKINHFDDLYHLKTKGFRGEALASIASVAQLTLSSHAPGFDPHEIIVHGGEIIDERICALPLGTTVTVKYLFYQTPARLKFLRSKETETSHVVDVITKMALSHPQIEFKLWNEDRLIFEAPLFQTALERVVSILGNDLRESLYPFSGEGAGMSVHGFFGHPQVALSQRNQSYFFVNGRAVNDKVLWHAVMEAYRDLLMKGRYPIMVLNLHVDENTIDVNVHPAKSEVRFHHPQQIHAFVHTTLRQHLQAAPWLQVSSALQNSAPPLPPFFGHPPLGGGQGEGNARTENPNVAHTMSGWSNQYFSQTSPSEKTYATQPMQTQIRFGKTSYADMTPIGQWHSTYILCESANKLVLIDQHAAHERIGFEKLMLQFRANSIPREPLLIPETFDLKPSDAELLKNYLGQLADFGIEVDYFGGNTFVVKAIPALFKNKMNLPQVIADVLADIKEAGELIALKDRLHLLFATMACHAQIRAHHHLSLTEMQALLKELDHYQFTDFCPHGRPVSIEITGEEIEKWFRRTL